LSSLHFPLARPLDDTDSVTRRGGPDSPKRLKVGGQALADGVLMRTERAWAVARADGSVVSGDLASPRWPKVPVLRVLASLGQGLWLGLGPARRPRQGRPRSYRMLSALVGAEATALGLDWMIGRTHLAGWTHPLIVIGLWMATIGAFRLLAPQVQWRYHGAEHKAVTAYERGLDLADVDSVLGCPRVHARCGTNLVVWLALCAPLLSRLSGPAQVVALPVALAVVAELLTIAARNPGSLYAKVALAPGAAMQFWVTTREPSATEQAIGCRALSACLARHHQVGPLLDREPSSGHELTAARPR
jgi:uncharacterized protein YqhQ